MAADEVSPRAYAPILSNGTVSENSSKRLASLLFCRLVKCMVSRSNCSDTDGFVCLWVFLVASWLQLAGSNALPSNRGVLVKGHRSR